MTSPSHTSDLFIFLTWSGGEHSQPGHWLSWPTSTAARPRLGGEHSIQQAVLRSPIQALNPRTDVWRGVSVTRPDNCPLFLRGRATPICCFTPQRPRHAQLSHKRSVNSVQGSRTDGNTPAGHDAALQARNQQEAAARCQSCRRPGCTLIPQGRDAL